jgi:hypothetical protein
MAQQITNIRNIQVNDIIQVTYNTGNTVNLVVTRAENKSWYFNNGGRNSYGTLEGLLNNSGDVVKCEIIKANK